MLSLSKLFDVVDETEELPLRIDLGPRTQGKAIESFVVTQIAEDGLDGGEALSVTFTAVGTVDVASHVSDKMVGARGGFGFKESDLSDLCFVGGAQCARTAITFSALEARGVGAVQLAATAVSV